MLTQLDSGNILIKLSQPIDIASVSFSNNTSSFFISSFSNENDFDLSPDMESSELIKNLMDSLDYDPDGYLAFVSHQYVDDFVNFVTHFLLEAEKNEELNYDNGGVSETFIFTKVDNGIIVEMIDPECFSPFFKNFLLEFNRRFSLQGSDFICVELNHIKTHIQYLVKNEKALPLLDILHRNHFQYLT